MKYLLLLLMMLSAPAAHAASAADGMSLMLMCQVYALGSGNVGLFLGFLIAIGGLYALLVKGSYKMGIVTIICGALLTALPGLVISSLKGVNTWLHQSDVTRQEVDLSVVLDRIVSYKDDCGKILIDLSEYEKYETMDGEYNPNGAVRSQGYNSKGAPINPDNIPDQNNSDAHVPGLACLGQVLDMKQYPSPQITSGWGMRVHPVYHTRKYHAGLDIAAPEGTRVLAYAGGTVEFSGTQNGYGNIINIQHGGGKNTQYAHLSQRLVQVGDTVSAGSVIGLVGHQGVGTGNHLHFEIRTGGKGTEIDPKPILCGG